MKSDGMLNDFKMMWEFRDRFPLHYMVFKQIGQHLPHEANIEQYFSRAGLLSDPNIDPFSRGSTFEIEALVRARAQFSLFY